MRKLLHVSTNVLVRVENVIKAVYMQDVERNVHEFFSVDILVQVTAEGTALHVRNSANMFVNMDLAATDVCHLAFPVPINVSGVVITFNAQGTVVKCATGLGATSNA